MHVHTCTVSCFLRTSLRNVIHVIFIYTTMTAGNTNLKVKVQNKNNYMHVHVYMSDYYIFFHQMQDNISTMIPHPSAKTAEMTIIASNATEALSSCCFHLPHWGRHVPLLQKNWSAHCICVQVALTGADLLRVLKGIICSETACTWN